jgi:hypothetical protein
MGPAKSRSATGHRKRTPARAPREKTGLRGPVGPPGPAGPVGPAGPKGTSGLTHTKDIRDLSEQIAQIHNELKIQLMRIAQIQAQLDRLASGLSPESSHPPDPDVRRH